MAKPDRQTDRATWWSITTFDAGEMEWIAAGVWPGFVAKIHGGPEMCPTSNRVHYQGAVQCKAQQRFAAIKDMLPKAHIEMARHREALRKYCMKEETAVGEKTVISNSTPYYTLEKLLMELAKVKPFTIADSDDPETSYWARANSVLRDHSFLVGMLATPTTYRAWKFTKQVWFEKVRLEEECIVLLTPPELGTPPTIRIEL